MWVSSFGICVQIYVFGDGLYGNPFAGLQEGLVGVNAQAGGVGEVEEVPVVVDAAGDRIDFVTEQAGVHVVEDDIVMGHGEVGEGSERYAAFEHATHHAGDTVLFTESIDPGG